MTQLAHTRQALDNSLQELQNLTETDSKRQNTADTRRTTRESPYCTVWRRDLMDHVGMVGKKNVGVVTVAGIMA